MLELGHGPPPTMIVTADDLIRGGLCRPGVRDRLEETWETIAAAMPVEDVLRLARPPDRKLVLFAAGLDGYGYDYGGDGYGVGRGYGYGYDDGCGYGDSDGIGYSYA